VARRIQRKELRKPDEFIGGATRALNWIADHRGALGISVGAVLLLVFGVMVVTQLRRSANVEDWRPLLGSVPVRAMPKGEGDESAGAARQAGPAVFVDEQKIAKVADAADSDQARALADLAFAGQLLAKGDAAAAEKRYGVYLSSNPPASSAGRLIAQEGLGYASNGRAVRRRPSRRSPGSRISPKAPTGCWRSTTRAACWPARAVTRRRGSCCSRRSRARIRDRRSSCRRSSPGSG